MTLASDIPMLVQGKGSILTCGRGHSLAVAAGIDRMPCPIRDCRSVLRDRGETETTPGLRTSGKIVDEAVRERSLSPTRGPDRQDGRSASARFRRLLMRDRRVRERAEAILEGYGGYSADVIRSTFGLCGRERVHICEWASSHGWKAQSARVAQSRAVRALREEMEGRGDIPR